MKNESEGMGPGAERRWERGWEEHETLQRQRLSRLPLGEKLQWLEEAHRMVLHLQANRPYAVDPENSAL